MIPHTKSAKVITNKSQAKTPVSMIKLKAAVRSIKAKQSLSIFRRRAFTFAAFFRHWAAFTGAVLLCLLFIFVFPEPKSLLEIIRNLVSVLLAFAYPAMYSHYLKHRYLRKHETHQLRRQYRREKAARDKQYHQELIAREKEYLAIQQQIKSSQASQQREPQP